jgi:hypothetical protein
LDDDFVNSNPHIKNYFNAASKTKPVELKKYSLDTNEIYLNQGSKIEEKCSVFDNLEFTYLVIALCAPILYFLTALCLIILYCKYRKIRQDYQRLQGHEDSDRNSDPNIHADPGMEMGHVNSD